MRLFTQKIRCNTTNILESNICDLVCVTIGSTVTHPEAKLMHPRNDKVPVRND